MAISSNGLAGLKPGVVDSTATRPSSPFEGQMIFQKDTDQLLIWNGSAWVIPNSPAQNPQALELITTGALSGTATNFAGCFTSTYENYRIVVSKFNGIGGFIGFRMLTGTTPFTSTVYHNALISANSLTSTTTTIDKAITTMGYFGYNFGNFTNGGFGSSYDMINPFSTGRMFFNGGYSSYYDITPLMSFGSGGGGLDNTASYDGIQILNANGGTLVGNVAIYGYRKA